MKKFPIFVLFVALFFSLLAGCEGIDDVSSDPNLRLRFSVDTLSFDTVFSTVGSTTKTFLVYNPNREALKIERIELAGAGAGGFRINVDGRKGTEFQDINIWQKDSLFISVEVTVHPNDATQPFVIEDSVLFYTNGVRQSVLLQAYGQNVHIIKGGVTLAKDTMLAADLPYLVYDSLMVGEGATLTLEKGVRFYMHNRAKMLIYGTIKAIGEQESPVLIRGDRLDNIEAEVSFPYDRTPGQWDGISFASSSYDNELDYVIIRNGVSGLLFHPSDPERIKIRIRNSQITNMDENLLVATDCRMEVAGSELTNAAGAVVSLTGGVYQFTHCTIANYKKVLGNSREFTPCLILSNTIKNDAAETLHPLQQASFDNCIIDGNFSADSMLSYRGEILFDTQTETEIQGDDATFNYRFNSCLVKTARVENSRFLNCLFVQSALYLKNGTKDEFFEYDFRLANESPGIGRADRSIAEQYPVDRYGVSRIEGETAPSIGAYEYVYQEPSEKDKK